MYWRPSWGEKPNDAPVSRSSTRRSAVGWPRATFLSDGAAPEEAGLDGADPDDEPPAGTSEAGTETAEAFPEGAHSDPRGVSGEPSSDATDDEHRSVGVVADSVPGGTPAGTHVSGRPVGDPGSEEVAEGAHLSERDGADMVRDSDDGPGYGDADTQVSRETGIEGWGVRPSGRSVPQPRGDNRESQGVEPVRFEPSAPPAPAPQPPMPHSAPPGSATPPGALGPVVPAPPQAVHPRSSASTPPKSGRPDPTRGSTVGFHAGGPNDRGAGGTLYGRGVSPAVDASPAEARPERRNTPSPRPHPSAVTADSEGAMTDAYVSRETEDPPLAQEAKRAVEILNPSGEITMPRPPRRRTMCVANQKGGVGKTTTAVNIAVALALHGNRVLVIDLDPQGNASTGLNVPHHSGVPDVYDCLIDGAPLDAVTQQVEGIPNLWAVPATIDLAGAEIELVSVVARESRLKRAIEAGGDAYDYIFIDCPPSLGLLTVNALVAAEEVLIPIQCEYYALEGVQALTNNIELVRSHLNPKLDITTVLLTMYDRRTRLADLVEQDVRNHFGEKCLNAVIPRNVRVSEAPSYSQSVMTYDPGSRGAVSYFEAAQEIALRGAQGAQVGGVA
ncbi:hypothetical protein GCM10018962_10770 [Dactylosporangium matsuzakiense]|uniref:AAA domain-containing protein n=2 Tax=Dactylosporangium matsuzakiense TaxID=53360 RepID=A0A9W6KEB9_9ACTN|nr:hypothetical protein GCM10017581_008250 [Dactylosporangium matsuzakiense]